MKLIKSKFEIIEQEPGLEGIYKIIEQAGRVCYKSESKITEGSAEKFVDRMIKSGHGAMLEHGTIYLKGTYDVSAIGSWNSSLANKYSKNKYSVVNYDNMMDIQGIYITTNLRVLVENDWLSDLKYICEPTEYHEKRVTVKWYIDRITGESFLRHRAIDEDHPTLEFAVTKETENDINSFARESTRFCNYSNSKFSNNIKFVIPSNIIYDFKTDFEYRKEYLNTLVMPEDCLADIEWFKSCLDSEYHYFKLIKLGWKPQFARYALGFSVLSPLVMTGFVSDWQHFFDLRCAPDAHPDAQVLAKPLQEEFIKRKYI